MTKHGGGRLDPRAPLLMRHIHPFHSFVDAEACVVGFSTIDRDSFENVESWIKKVSAVVRKERPAAVERETTSLHHHTMSLTFIGGRPVRHNPHGADTKQGKTRGKSCVAPAFATCAAGCVLGCVLTSRPSLQQIDLVDQAAMTKEEAEALADRVSVRAWRC